MCVTPCVRAQVKADNGKAADRRVSAKLWITRYTVPPVDNGDGTATSTSVDDIPRLKINSGMSGRAVAQVKGSSDRPGVPSIVIGVVGGSAGTRRGPARDPPPGGSHPLTM
ncbi:hypothetical protein [Microbispora bryophytorum]|uniref:hypothetical protein n=1 Tax=Microbispora bryophytorum TaxID=1460882 RepID=UPI003408E6D6